jgi:hypothetical protein
MSQLALFCDAWATSTLLVSLRMLCLDYGAGCNANMSICLTYVSMA